MRERINAVLEDAIRIGDRRRISTLRLIKTTIKDRDDAARAHSGERVDDDGIAGILLKMVRQRLESAGDYEEAGQLDLAEQERHEIAIIEDLLPEQFDEDQVRSICAETIAKTGAAGLRDVGKCMHALKSRYKGRMDFAKAGVVVRGMLR
ncbi:MAG: GatB/YqeY domain-containing protein [Alphaproteobacteria bacterium]